jgi:hypothetical protein
MRSEPTSDPGHNEVAALAKNLARNCRFALFPCNEDKLPTLKRWPERASTEAQTIERLWRHYPGPLIGIATGEASGIDALDLDVKHDAARAWWLAHRDQMPPTRAFRTRSGGVHFYFRHAPGVRNSAGKIALGVDVRGSGGFVISWFAAGLPCLNHAPTTWWPPWLLQLILPPPPKPIERRAYTTRSNPDAAIAGILRTVANAGEGTRNQRLNWAAFRMGARVVAGAIGRGEAESLLADAARAAGLAKIEADRTIASGLKGAGA